jgi:thiol-disulfide isomerase/thioredoxin
MPAHERRPVTARRRRLLLAGGAALAAVAGAGGYVWRERRFERATGGVWSLVLPTPAGADLDFARLRGRPLMLNFWATWCPPCLREMPLLDRFHAAAAARGWQVVGLAADTLQPVRDFLLRSPVRYPVVLAGGAGITLARRLGNPDGALPFTVLFGADGHVRRRKRGELSEQELALWLSVAGTAAASSKFSISQRTADKTA